MNHVGPIGVFDSGYGGLTILKEIKQLLPEYDFLYLGDNARSPYGSRSFDVIYEYTWQAVQALFESDCSLVILACNTASAKALRNIQQLNLVKAYPKKRVLGVIRPSVEELAKRTHSKHIGVLATEGTVKSGSYPIELDKLAPECKVSQHACSMWVPLIENNLFDTEGGRFFIQQDVQALIKKDPLIDTVLLGCTHYPIIENTIKEFLPKHVEVLTQGKIVASSLVDYLIRHPEINDACSKNGTVRYLTSENEQAFNERASLFINELIKAEHFSLH